MTRAVTLAEIAEGDILNIDGTNQRVGIVSTTPTTTLDVGGAVKATSFTGNVTGNATGLTGTPDIAVRNITGVAATFTGVLTYEDVTNIDSVGIITAQSDVSIADKIIHTGDTNTAIRFPAADTFTVETAGTERMRIDGSGRLLVGTTTVDDTATALVIKNSASGNDHTFLDIVCDTNETARVRFSEDGSNFPGEIKYDTWSHSLSFNADSAERMRIDSSGRLSLGATSSTVLSTFALSSTNAYSSTGNISNDNVGLKLLNTNGSDGTGANNYTGIQFNVASGATSSGSLAYVRTADNQGAFVFNQRTGASSYAEAMRIDSSGRLLVGTSSAPTVNLGAYSKFHVEGYIGAGGATGAGYMSLARGQSASSALAAGTEIGSLSFTDEVGATFAQIAARTDATTSTSDYPGRLVFSTTADGASSPTERMRIDNQGRIFTYNANTGNNSLTVANAAAAGTTVANFIGAHGANGVDTGTSSFIVWTNGNVVNTNNSYGAISDIKLKENIVDASSQWNDLKALQVRNYNFKEGQTHTQLGLIAQEVELVSPGLVSESPDRDEDGNDLGTVTKSVNYSVLYMKAVKALQEAMERIETLEQRLTDAGL